MEEFDESLDLVPGLQDSEPVHLDNAMAGWSPREAWADVSRSIIQMLDIIDMYPLI